MGRNRRNQRRRSKSGTRRGRAASGGANPLVWLGGLLGIVVVLAVLNLWQSGAFAGPPEATRSKSPGELFPLAEEVMPLSGGHDMARIPAQTPAPVTAPEGTPLPRLDLPSAEHDFGRIPPRPDVAHIFAVQNTGDADLRIDNLVTSCGCTTARLSSSVLPPGQRADLVVTFDPDFHPTEGQVVRLVWFATNDPAQPWAEVRILAETEQ